MQRAAPDRDLLTTSGFPIWRLPAGYSQRQDEVQISEKKREKKGKRKKERRGKGNEQDGGVGGKKVKR
jgi:hypothetical protein